MSARTLRLVSIRRTSQAGEDECLTLTPGVNVIVGLKDTGKTGWLHTISYVLGDDDTAKKALGTAPAAKFDSAKLEMLVDGTQKLVLERRWKEHGAKQKIFVDGVPVAVEDFSSKILSLLGIPVLHVPRGNPYSGTTWPELSWRTLFRHIYREERFWSDLADKQPEREQHACLLQFLGVAEKLFPKELGEQVGRHLTLLKLKARREQFESVLQHAARDLTPDPAVSNAPTLDAIDDGVRRLRQEIDETFRQRDRLLQETLTAASGSSESDPQNDARLAEERFHLGKQREELDQKRLAAEQRIAELARYNESVLTELERMKRVAVAGEIFKPLNVTRCPHCDQRVDPTGVPAGTCFVCHQGVPAESGVPGAGKRIAFEEEQLTAERSELDDLLNKVDEERLEIVHRIRRLDERIDELSVLLRAIRSAVVAVLPPGLSILDSGIGRLEERIAQLGRLRTAVEERDQLSNEIDSLADQEKVSASAVDAKSASIPFEQLSDVMTDGINEYLNHLKAGNPNRWLHEQVRVRISEHGTKVSVGDSPLSKLGVTSIGMVVLGYNYALLKLTARNGYNYPGFALIDFPMTFADGMTIADKENYLIEPFVRLAIENRSVQVVICGRAFTGLQGAHRIELKTVWTQGEEQDLPEA